MRQIFMPEQVSQPVTAECLNINTREVVTEYTRNQVIFSDDYIRAVLVQMVANLNR